MSEYARLPKKCRRAVMMPASLAQSHRRHTDYVFNHCAHSVSAFRRKSPVAIEFQFATNFSMSPYPPGKWSPASSCPDFSEFGAGSQYRALFATVVMSARKDYRTMTADRFFNNRPPCDSG